MKGAINILVFILYYCQGHSQSPCIEVWDKRFGGTNNDSPWSFQQTKDGGFVLGGYSNSGISGNKTQNNWDTINGTDDYWIVKIDSLGNKEWDKRFGGTLEDALYVIQQTTDGGYILGGESFSGANGDKTQPSWGYGDYWVVKTDNTGNKMWDKRYGGFNLEGCNSIQQTKDKGYILGGSSNSGISGDKTQDDWDSTYNTNDYWIIKMDSNGFKQWDKRFGGSSEDELASVLQTYDGGYVLGGISNSPISGDKTQANWDSSLQSYDFWIVKIDSDGTKQWDKRFGPWGGANFSSLIQTRDGGYILAGSTGDSIGGDKTQNICTLDGLGGADYWIVKIDSNGNKLGDWDFGGNANEEAPVISQTLDGGFLISGYSSSPASCEKTENDLGHYQVWMVKTDSLFNKQWDKTIFTMGNDNGYSIQTREGCYVTMVNTEAGVSGYKTQPNWDATNQTTDYWIVKFCFTGFGEAVKDLTNNLQLNIYPNPFTSELDISISQPNLTQADISICNILGQTVYNQHETNLSPTYTKMLDLSYLPNGVYLVEVVVDGEVNVKEVVKQ